MKDKWRKKYRNCIQNSNTESRKILTGFDVSIQTHAKAGEISRDLENTEPKIKEPVKSISQLESCIKYCKDNNQNRNVRGENVHELLPDERKASIGGGAGVSANFLSKTGNYVGMYTPILSKEITEELHEKVVTPVLDGKMVLKRAEDCTDSDSTKKDTIVNLNNGENYLKISDKIHGFGPYFRSGIEENFDSLDEEFDRIILSGFQESRGNIESKIVKSSKQLEKIETEKHLEYVTMSKEKLQLMMREVIPKFESISLDETGAKEIAGELDIETQEKLSAETAVKIGEKLIKEQSLERCHLQTYRYQVCLARPDYRIDKSSMRDAMIYGQVSSVAMAEKGSIPNTSDLEKLDVDGKHVHRLDPLEQISDIYNTDSFVKTGTYSNSNLKIAAIPTLIEEEPKRVQGIRSVSSSAAFVHEMK